MTNLGAMCTLFLAEFLSPSGQLGTNVSSFADPPAVLDSAPLIRGAAGGLGAVTPTGVPPTESPGEVLPMIQEDVPPPNFNVRVSDSVARSWVVSLGGPLDPGLGPVTRFSDGTDQLRVTGVSLGAYVNVAPALSPRSLLFPFLILVSLPCPLLFPPLLLLLLLLLLFLLLPL